MIATQKRFTLTVSLPFISRIAKGGNMKEIWKDVPKFEGIYAVSNTGKVKVLTHKVIRKDGKPYTCKEKILKPHQTKGYLQATLSVEGTRFFYGVHRLVALAFIPNPQNKPEVNHKDGNKLNNCLDNLEWVTTSENIHHAFDTGLKTPVYGNRKLTDDNIRFIKNAYENRTSRFWGKKKIAKDLNISMSAIDMILQGKTWGNIY